MNVSTGKTIFICQQRWNCVAFSFCCTMPCIQRDEIFTFTKCRLISFIWCTSCSQLRWIPLHNTFVDKNIRKHCKWIEIFYFQYQTMFFWLFLLFYCCLATCKINISRSFESLFITCYIYITVQAHKVNWTVPTIQFNSIFWISLSLTE